jgi:hypothetical protein
MSSYVRSRPLLNKYGDEVEVVRLPPGEARGARDLRRWHGVTGSRDVVAMAILACWRGFTARGATPRLNTRWSQRLGGCGSSAGVAAKRSRLRGRHMIMRSW